MAEQAKHTPGPWVFEDDLVRAGGIIIHNPFDAVTTADEMEANAALIATAPELLEWAKRMVEVHPCKCSTQHQSNHCTRCRLVMKIAKAERKE